MSEFTSIEQIRKSVTSCTKCDLCKTRTKSVPGKGSENAKIIFVGEAPGKSEDLRGEPFVGSAGKILDAALENAGISRDSVYITNTTKCRPPSNRVPKKEERAACAPYLESEIKLISPDIVCIMGNTAYASILGGTEITKNRGKVITHNGTKYFLSLHPAAIIYNGSLKKSLEDDMKKLAEMVSK